MSRLRLLTQSLSSGYVQVAANTVFTIVSVPLALHYLSREEFGLWALVTQIVGYLALVDLGISAALVRLLIDHKDRPSGGAYGSVIKTGSLVLVVQGILVALLAWVLGFGLANLLDVPLPYVRSFRLLVLGHGLLTGVLFAFRMFGSVLQAHQRYDVVNYSNGASFAVHLAVLWLGFHTGMGLFSLLAAYAAATLFSMVTQVAATLRLRLLPPAGARGRVEGKVFKEVFVFGSDLFLISVGLQLLNASQLVIIKMTLGLEMVAVWSIATKGFMLVQQLVWRLWDFSASAISEMMVRQEDARVRQRFQDIFTVTASVSVFAGIGVAVCNDSFLMVWTKNKISWSGWNNVLMAVLFFTTSVTRLHVGLIATTKRLRGMRYIYFLEGLSFVTAAFLIARWWGIPGVIAAAIVMNLLWTGIYGTLRTAQELRLPPYEVTIRWTAPAAWFGLTLMPVAFLCWWLARPLPSVVRLVLSFTIVGAAGLLLFWKFGLTPSLREEVRSAIAKIRRRFSAVG